MKAKKILIVENDLPLLRGLKDNFQAQGYQVRTASDGQKGLEAILRDPPDVVLLDLLLPKLNGYEICRAARSRQLRSAIIMLSAKDHEDDIVRGLELGADDYVTKAFNIRVLIARARTCSQRCLGPSSLTHGQQARPGQGPRASEQDAQPAFSSAPHALSDSTP